MNIGDIFKHNDLDHLLELIKIKRGGINVFLEIGQDRKPILTERKWSFRKVEQIYIMRDSTVKERLVNISKEVNSKLLLSLT